MTTWAQNNMLASGRTEGHRSLQVLLKPQRNGTWLMLHFCPWPGILLLKYGKMFPQKNNSFLPARPILCILRPGTSLGIQSPPTNLLIHLQWLLTIIAVQILRSTLLDHPHQRQPRAGLQRLLSARECLSAADGFRASTQWLLLT